jgi:hypothetical protein
VGCHWVFAVKLGHKGSVDFGLTTKGFIQIFVLDHGGVLSLVTKHCLHPKLFHVLQMDAIKNIFLHGDLIDEIYMEQTLGFVA